MSLPQLVYVCVSRQRVMFASVLVLCLGGVALLTFSLPRVYQATANLSVGENRGVTQQEIAAEVDEGLARTYAELLKTAAVRQAVARALPFRISQGELAGKVSSEAVTGTKLVRIAAEDARPSRAQIIANTYARTFVERQRQQLKEAASTTLKDLSRRVGQLSRRLRSLGNRAPTGDQTEVRGTRAELTAALRTFTTTQQRAALNQTNLSVASLALTPQSAVRPRPAIYLLVGAIFSLILASVAAFARDAFDKRIGSEEELVELVRAPVLTRVPDGLGKGQRIEDAFQLLRLNLQLSDPEGEIGTLAVVSASGGDGKSTVVFRLAAAFAFSGAKVEAIDCDLRSPMLHRLFSVDGSDGISNLLVGSRALDEVTRATANPNLHVVPSGPTPPSPSVLLGQRRLAEVMETLARRADYVVVDTSSLAFGADASAVAAAADAAIVVADLGRTRRDTLIAAREQLDKTRARVVGVVLNRVPDGAGARADYRGGPGRPLRARPPQRSDETVASVPSR